MGDTKAGRVAKGHDEEKRQRERELAEELERREEADARRAEHETEEAEEELARDE